MTGAAPPVPALAGDDVTFPSMGSHARLIVEGVDAAPARAFLAVFEQRLTRFDPASELCALNASPADIVPASPLLRRFVVAALWAAERSGGLVDPTLLRPLRDAGYDRDLRVGGPGAAARPFDVQVRHPLTGEVAHELRLRGGAVATSGLNVRLWRGADGRPAHHLLDPSTGRPAWTGLVGATALAPTALEAETLAKTALLSGSARVLARHGGLVVRDDGEVELAGRLRPRVVVSLAIPKEVLAA